MLDEEIEKYNELDFIDIRYWRGKVKCCLLGKYKKKALIMYLESGDIGTIDLGKKRVYMGERDITLIRHCWRSKK